MVGIILASHGAFSQGILQSGKMIFGEQENVVAVTLEPSEGPNDIYEKMKEAVAHFDDPKEVLLLVDLWGGTPFNQASALIKEHEDTWAILTGLNLPMLLEAYGLRLSTNKAQEISKSILEAGRTGVKIYPESLDTIKQKKPAIAKEPVTGKGEIEFVLVRVDSRLLHGQVATAWTKATKPSRIIVVSDAVAQDSLRKQLIEQAAPPGVKANVVPVAKMIEVVKDSRFGGTKALLLFENPQDVLRLIDGGAKIKEINVGSMAHTLGKVSVNKAISLNKEDIQTLEQLLDKGIQFDVRKVPSDTKENMRDIIEKAKRELSKT